ERGRDVAPGGNSAEDAFFGSEATRHRQALGGGRGDNARQERHVEVLGDEAVADALDAGGSPLALGRQPPLLGLDRVEAHARIPLAQEAPDTRQRAAAAL